MCSRFSAASAIYRCREEPFWFAWRVMELEIAWVVHGIPRTSVCRKPSSSSVCMTLWALQLLCQPWYGTHLCNSLFTVMHHWSKIIFSTCLFTTGMQMVYSIPALTYVTIFRFLFLEILFILPLLLVLSLDLWNTSFCCATEKIFSTALHWIYEFVC